MPLPSPADLLRIWIGAVAGLWPQLHVLHVLYPLTLKTKFALDLSSLNTSLGIMKHTRHYLQATFYILKDSHGMLVGKPLCLTNASALVRPRGLLIAIIIPTNASTLRHSEAHSRQGGGACHRECEMQIHSTSFCTSDQRGAGTLLGFVE